MPQFEIFKIVPTRYKQTFHIGKHSESTINQYQITQSIL